MVVSTSTTTMRVSAPAHALVTAVANAEPACWNTNKGNADCGPLNALVLVTLFPKDVSNNGAVSPVTLATASMTPVVMPADAEGSTTDSTVRQRGTPRA